MVFLAKSSSLVGATCFMLRQTVARSYRHRIRRHTGWILSSGGASGGGVPGFGFVYDDCCCGLRGNQIGGIKSAAGTLLSVGSFGFLPALSAVREGSSECRVALGNGGGRRAVGTLAAHRRTFAHSRGISGAFRWHDMTSCGRGSSVIRNAIADHLEKGSHSLPTGSIDTAQPCVVVPKNTLLGVGMGT